MSKEQVLIGQERVVIDALEEICQAMADGQVSYADMASAMGISTRAFRRLLRGDTLTVRQLFEMARVLGLKLVITLE